MMFLISVPAWKAIRFSSVKTNQMGSMMLETILLPWIPTAHNACSIVVATKAPI
ncbi:hypothetical protein D3C72_2587640 [compost metagenome]